MADQQKLIDKVIEASRGKLNSEVGGLLGTKLSTVKTANRMVSRAQLLQMVGKSVLATLKVEGELQGEMYLLVSIKDAILFGGTLIMLPAAELESRVNGEEFVADEADAFGEIANIISGLYSATFEELYPQKIHLVKSDLKVVVPAEVAADSAEPFPEQMYYMASSLMSMAGKQLDEIRLLFPAELFGLGADTAGKTKEAAKAATPQPAAGARQPGPSEVPSAAGEEEPPPPVAAGAGAAQQILVIAENGAEGQIFAETIQECGYSTQLLGFSDKVKNAAAGGVAGVFLVMGEVNEKGMAAIIKAKSVCGNSSPLIAAGPQWTRKTVLQAVKYGACDIVVTPVVPAEIRQKVEAHLGVNA